MLYNVIELSESTGISKQSIYAKLKLKIIQDHVIKKQGITYVDEVGFNLIKDSIKINTKDSKDLNNEDTHNLLNEDIVEDTEILSLNKELFNTLKQQLKEKDLQLTNNNLQLIEKDLQIHELHKLIENNQVLLKEKPQDLKLLEEHFQDLDTKLIDIREQMGEHKESKDQEHKGFFNKLFKH